jgi:predicted CXXCH cytochrome family protein
MRNDSGLSYRTPLILAVLCALLCVATGCDKYSRHQVLSFLFDGVPHPDAPQKKAKAATKETGGDQREKKEQSTEKPKFKHPAAEGKDDCSFCHGKVTSAAMPPKDICVKCHQHLKEKRPFLHGPAVVDCIVCHNPHESETKTLLKKKGGDLCQDCHDIKDVQKAEPHKDMKPDELLCDSCHDPHGGKDKFFLR